jgi:hypothetical protein
MTTLLYERLQDAFREFGWTRIPEVVDHHAEEAAKHNISYLEFWTSCCRKNCWPNGNGLSA